MSVVYVGFFKALLLLPILKIFILISKATELDLNVNIYACMKFSLNPWSPAILVFPSEGSEKQCSDLGSAAAVPAAYKQTENSK